MGEITILTEFARDTMQGLASSPKHLSSKYFYDKRGSKIFQDIMHMPEYYLTDAELDIFETHKQAIFESFSVHQSPFELIELGAGDGLKTKILLTHFLNQKAQFKYTPIDISKESLLNLVSEIKNDLPELEVEGKTGDYFHLIEEMNRFSDTKKVILFLGSNIGNYTEVESLRFLNKLRSGMHPEDLLLIGFDLKKEAGIILKAYDDQYGHTAAFNLNHLRRINEELHADFELKQFNHQETYDPKTGTAKSWLVSLKKQDIYIQKLDKTFSFNQGESILMEISQKYDLEMIKPFADKSGFEIVRNYYDRRHWFVDSLWKLKSHNTG